MKIVVPTQFEAGYIFDSREIEEATTPEYRAFLKEAGYVDLEETPNLFVAHKVLRIEDHVLSAAEKAGIKVNYDKRKRVNHINQRNASSLISSLGGRVLTSRLMYGLVIPHLTQSDSDEARATLEEMTNEMVEFLQDSILNKNKVRIGNAEREIALPKKDGYFDRSDLNEFGYPNQVKKAQGEHYFWFPNGAENVVIRDWGSELSLNLNWDPSSADVVLGVRFAKFF